MKLFQPQISRLSMTNPDYRKFVMDFLELLLAQDVGKSDITTTLLTKPKKIIQAEILAKERGVLAGIEEAEFFLKQKGVRILKKKRDGAVVKKNDVVFVLQASAKKILTLERVVLNLIQRMSGIATATAELAKKIGERKFSATRKTPLGILDSRAVVVGGGLPHRLNLADMILVKENHLAVDPNCWKKIHTKDFFEIEADSPKLAIEIATHFSKSKKLILMLDNFSVAQFRETAMAIRKTNPKIILEASGGIDEKTAPKFLEAGADFVSLGKLTNSAGVVDFSLKVV